MEQYLFNTSCVCICSQQLVHTHVSSVIKNSAYNILVSLMSAKQSILHLHSHDNKQTKFDSLCVCAHAVHQTIRIILTDRDSAPIVSKWFLFYFALLIQFCRQINQSNIERNANKSPTMQQKQQ